MTAAGEALVLPAIFLTVTLLGGVRVASTGTVLEPPSLFALVLGVLLMRVLIRSGAVVPERLVASSRRALANANGFSVLVTTWLAAAQTIATLTPEGGVPRVVVNVYFVLLLVNTAAADPDRRHVLRSLAITFGCLFVLKYVVLQELSAPGAGWLKRVLQAMLEGVTLGTLSQPVMRPITGYIAFAAVGLFLIGLALMPTQARSKDLRIYESEDVSLSGPKL